MSLCLFGVTGLRVRCILVFLDSCFQLYHLKPCNLFDETKVKNEVRRGWIEESESCMHVYMCVYVCIRLYMVMYCIGNNLKVKMVNYCFTILNSNGI